MGKPFSECTSEELESKSKTLKTLATILLTVIVGMIAYTFYRIVNKIEFDAATVIAPTMCLIAAMLPVIAGLGKIKKELASREASNG